MEIRLKMSNQSIREVIDVERPSGNDRRGGRSHQNSARLAAAK